MDLHRIKHLKDCISLKLTTINSGYGTASYTLATSLVSAFFQ